MCKKKRCVWHFKIYFFSIFVANDNNKTKQITHPGTIIIFQESSFSTGEGKKDQWLHDLKKIYVNNLHFFPKLQNIVRIIQNRKIYRFWILHFKRSQNLIHIRIFHQRHWSRDGQKIFHPQELMEFSAMGKIGNIKTSWTRKE